MGIVVFCGILAVALIGFGVSKLFSKSLQTGSAEAAERGKVLPALSKEDKDKLSAARRNLASATQKAKRMKDTALRSQADAAIKQAEKILAEMKNQPAEIRRAKQFFIYYLPTIDAVLGKYTTLEANGMATGEHRITVGKFLSNATEAFRAQYESMFKDEKLDLEVETEAMEVALRRDGLL